MKQITGHTGLTGLFGSPVAHSISPMMHNASFEHLDLIMSTLHSMSEPTNWPLPWMDFAP